MPADTLLLDRVRNRKPSTTDPGTPFSALRRLSLAASIQGAVFKLAFPPVSPMVGRDVLPKRGAPMILWDPLALQQKTVISSKGRTPPAEDDPKLSPHHPGQSNG